MRTRRGAAEVAVLASLATLICSCSTRGPADAGADAGGISYAEWRDRNAGAPGAAVRARAADVFESFAGTAEQRNAEYVLVAYGFNGSLDACLEKAGFPDWDWSLSRNYAVPMDALSRNEWVQSPVGQWRSENQLALRPRMRAEEEMNRDDIPADQAQATMACLETTEGRQVVPGVHPKNVPSRRLSTRWWSTIGGYSPQGMPTEDAYWSCLKDADVEILEREGYPDEEPKGGVSPDPADIPADPTDARQWSDEGWQEFLALEREYTRADWACREATYLQFIDGVVPVIEEFSEKYAAEIAEAQRRWAEISASAADLGYHGQIGPMGG